MPLIAPSLLASNFAILGEEVAALDKAGADYMHLDVMDGHFVPNLTFGPDIVKALRPYSNKVFDAHLMIAPVDPYLEVFAKAGCDIITIHLEASPHTHRSVQAIKALGCKAGVALNPATPIEMVYPLLSDIDMVLIMSVNPGFGGQSFIPFTLDKIQALKKHITAHNLDVKIQVDGGVTAQNASDIIAAGADILVAGSAVFKPNDGDYARNIAALRG